MNNIQNKTIGIEQVAGMCDKVTWANRYSFTACCLAHEDRNPSMSVTETEDGRLLMYCHAGCAQEELLAAAGFGNRPITGQKQVVRPIKSQMKPTFDYAVQLWAAAVPDEDYVSTHPYSIKKKVRGACGAARGAASGKLIGRDADCVIVPMRNLEGQLVGVECISADGVKQTFGSKGLLVLGNDLDTELPIIIFEGWASACGWLNICDWNGCAVASFGKGTADRAADAVKAHYPGHIVLVGRERD